MQAVFAGEIGWNVTLFIDRIPEPDEKLLTSHRVESAGGLAANAALACSRAGAPAQAWLACGDDAVGQDACRYLAGEGVDVRPDLRPGPTCRNVILVEPGGERRLLRGPGVSMYPSAKALRAANLDGVSWVHTAADDPAAAAILVARCRERGIRWSLDLEPATFAHDIGVLADCLDGAEAVFCNAREGRLLGADPAAALFGHGVRCVVLSRGALGASWRRGSEGVAIYPPTGLGVVVDTTGAGDCLAGWFVAERLRRADATEALTAAVVAASLSCMAAGGQPSFPKREAVRPSVSFFRPRTESHR